MPMEISKAEERQLVQRARDAIESGDQCGIEAVLHDYCDALARKEDFRHASMIADHRSAAHTLVLLPYWHRRPDAQTHRLLRDSAVLQIAHGAFAMIDCFEPRTDLPQLVATEFTALGVWPGSDLWSQVRQAVTKLCGPGPCPVSVDVHSTEITPAASLRPILPDGEPI